MAIVKIIQPGDLLLHSGDTKTDKLVRYLTDSEYSRATLYLGSGKIYTANKDNRPNIGMFPEEFFDSDNSTVYRHRNMTQRRWYKMNRAIADRHVTVYDPWIIWRIWKKSKFSGRDDEDIKDGNGEVCSTLLASLYEKSGMQVNDDIHPSQITPQDFADSDYFWDVEDLVSQ